MGDTVMQERLAAERLLAERVVARGTVKWFSIEEGHGLICADEGDDDLPFRAASVADASAPALTQGVRVWFEVDEGSHGLEAFAVVVVESEAEHREPGPLPGEGHSESWTPPTRALPPRR